VKVTGKLDWVTLMGLDVAAVALEKAPPGAPEAGAEARAEAGGEKRLESLR